MNPCCNFKETFNSVGSGPTGIGWKVEMKDTVLILGWIQNQPPRAVVSLFFLLFLLQELYLFPLSQFWSICQTKLDQGQWAQSTDSPTLQEPTNLQKSTRDRGLQDWAKTLGTASGWNSCRKNGSQRNDFIWSLRQGRERGLCPENISNANRLWKPYSREFDKFGFLNKNFKKDGIQGLGFPIETWTLTKWNDFGNLSQS